METRLDLNRWQEKPRGVGHRRWAIVSTGLRQMFRGRFLRFLLFLGCVGGFLIAAAGFSFSQAVASGGWLESLATQFGPRAHAIVSSFTALVLMYPDIVVRGLYASLFWLHSFFGLGLTLVAITAIVPRLVTRDRATNALTIYLARPLTSTDYLLGKLGIVGGLVLALWTLPMLAGWFLSLLLSPNRDFIVYSLQPLGRALLFNGIALVALACITLGTSAVSRTSRNTIALWIALWIIAGAVADAPNSPSWLKHASFSYDLGHVRQAVLRLDDVLDAAAKQLPLFNRDLSNNLQHVAARAQPEGTTSAIAGLGVLVALSSFVFFRRLRPE